MKKSLIIIGSILGVVVLLFIVARMTGLLLFYTIESGSSEPTLKMGSRVFATPLIKPQRLDFICFRGRTAFSKGKNETYIYRLVAIGGDTVEIRDGLLYVNGERIDTGINLNREYLVSSTEMMKVRAADENWNDKVLRTIGDTTLITEDEKFMTDNKIEARMFIHNLLNDSDEYIKAKYNANWNVDRFGPVVLPAHYYFALGDNRHNALDCRYQGFIPESAVLGTLISAGGNK